MGKYFYVKAKYFITSQKPSSQGVSTLTVKWTFRSWFASVEYHLQLSPTSRYHAALLFFFFFFSSSRFLSCSTQPTPHPHWALCRLMQHLWLSGTNARSSKLKGASSYPKKANPKPVLKFIQHMTGENPPDDSFLYFVELHLLSCWIASTSNFSFCQSQYILGCKTNFPTGSLI